MRFIKPLDTKIIDELSKSHDLLVTLEENVIAGGAGSGVSEYLNSKGIQTSIIHLGLPDAFLPHGKHSSLLEQCNLSAQGIEDSIRNKLNEIAP